MVGTSVPGHTNMCSDYRANHTSTLVRIVHVAGENQPGLGLWEKGGMVAHLGQAYLARLRRMGIAPLTVAQGMSLQDATLERPAADWVPAHLRLAALRERAEDADIRFCCAA